MAVTDPRSHSEPVYLVPVWILRLHPNAPGVVRLASDAMGEVWAWEDDLHRADKNAREIASWSRI